MPAPWNDWYHCNGNTFGTWLPGSDWGFRTRHHRRHIDGDYKNPPPPGKYANDLARSNKLMRRPKVILSLAARRLICDAIFESLRGDGILVVAACVNGHHFHALAKFPDRRPRHWVGRAKGRSAPRRLRRGLGGRGRRLGQALQVQAGQRPRTSGRGRRVHQEARQEGRRDSDRVGEPTGPCASKTHGLSRGLSGQTTKGRRSGSQGCGTSSSYCQT